MGFDWEYILDEEDGEKLQDAYEDLLDTIDRLLNEE